MCGVVGGYGIDGVWNSSRWSSLSDMAVSAEVSQSGEMSNFCHASVTPGLTVINCLTERTLTRNIIFRQRLMIDTICEHSL